MLRKRNLHEKRWEIIHSNTRNQYMSGLFEPIVTINETKHSYSRNSFSGYKKLLINSRTWVCV